MSRNEFTNVIWCVQWWWGIWGGILQLVRLLQWGLSTFSAPGPASQPGSHENTILLQSLTDAFYCLGLSLETALLLINVAIVSLSTQQQPDKILWTQVEDWWEQFLTVTIFNVLLTCLNGSKDQVEIFNHVKLTNQWESLRRRSVNNWITSNSNINYTKMKLKVVSWTLEAIAIHLLLNWIIIFRCCLHIYQCLRHVSKLILKSKISSDCCILAN